MPSLFHDRHENQLGILPVIRTAEIPLDGLYHLGTGPQSQKKSQYKYQSSHPYRWV